VNLSGNSRQGRLGNGGDDDTRRDAAKRLRGEMHRVFSLRVLPLGAASARV